MSIAPVSVIKPCTPSGERKLVADIAAPDSEASADQWNKAGWPTADPEGDVAATPKPPSPGNTTEVSVQSLAVLAFLTCALAAFGL